MNYYNYFTEVEDTFVRRRGKNLFISPLDWAMIEAWKGRGIPLHIIIRSIESVFDVFDKQPLGTRTIKTLFYCRDEVEAQYSEWLTSQTGKSDDKDESSEQFSIAAVADHVAKSIASLKAIDNSNLSEDIDRAVSRLEELTENLTDDFETVDQTLGDIEKLLDRSMMTNWDVEHLMKLKKEVADQLRIYKAEMEPDAYKNTFDLMLLKRLREEAGIPRLGLFYL
jgi:hypothetical protein